MAKRVPNPRTAISINCIWAFERFFFKKIFNTLVMGARKPAFVLAHLHKAGDCERDIRLSVFDLHRPGCSFQPFPWHCQWVNSSRITLRVRTYHPNQRGSRFYTIRATPFRMSNLRWWRYLWQDFPPNKREITWAPPIALRIVFFFINVKYVSVKKTIVYGHISQIELRGC